MVRVNAFGAGVLGINARALLCAGGRRVCDLTSYMEYVCGATLLLARGCRTDPSTLAGACGGTRQGPRCCCICWLVLGLLRGSPVAGWGRRIAAPSCSA